jgi:hypothetical protein
MPGTAQESGDGARGMDWAKLSCWPITVTSKGLGGGERKLYFFELSQTGKRGSLQWQAGQKEPLMRVHREVSMREGHSLWCIMFGSGKGLLCPVSYLPVNQRLGGTERAKSDQLFLPALSLWSETHLGREEPLARKPWPVTYLTASWSLPQPALSSWAEHL